MSARGGPERVAERADDPKRAARKRARSRETRAAPADIASFGVAAPLPHRTALEAGFGTSLADVGVRVGSDARALLDAAGAQAASVGNVVLLPERGAALPVVAHEVAHVLQRRGGVSLPGLEPAASPAERAADHAVADPSGPGLATTATADAPRQVALLRTANLPWLPLRHAEKAGSPQRPEATIEGRRAWMRALLGEGGGTDLTSVDLATDAMEADTVDDVGSTRAEMETDAGAEPPGPEAAGPESAPERAPAGAPEEARGAVPTEVESEALTNALAAPSRASPATEAEAAELPEATDGEAGAVEAVPSSVSASFVPVADAGAAMDQYAVATPSQQAVLFPALGGAVAGGAAAEAEAFHAGLAVVGAELQGKEELPPVDAAALAPANTPSPDLTLPTEPTVAVDDPEAQADARLPGADALDGLGEEATAAEKAARLDSALKAPVQLDVTTSPGPAPDVPRIGTADPDAAKAVAAEAGTNADDAVAAARDALEAGPGPEVVAPLAEDAEAQVGELRAASVAEPPDIDAMATVRDVPLPDDVRGTFDARMAEATATRTTAARDGMTAAATAQTEARTAAEGDAERAIGELERTQAAEQAKVVKARQADIREARANTRTAQDEARDEVDVELGAEAEASRKAVEERFTHDEDAIAARYTTAENDAKDAAKAADGEVLAEKAKAAKKTEEGGWWDRAVNLVKGLLDAYLEAVKRVFDALRRAVKTLLDAARSFATDLIQKAVAFATEAIQKLAELAKKAVDALLAEAFPELARKLKEAIDAAQALATELIAKVGDALIAGVNAITQLLQAAFDRATAAYEALIDGVVGALRSGLDVDWGNAVRWAIEAALTAAGVDPAGFFALIGEGEEVLAALLSNPGKFVQGVIQAAWQGVTQFGERITTHLQAGFVAWLTGAFAGSLTLPASWDFWGVIDVVRQVMGLTLEGVKALARRVVGNAAVDAIEWVVEQVEVLIDGGWPALWAKITGDLSALVEMVVPEIVQWAVVSLVKAALPKLLAFIDPTFIAAIVTAVQMLWGAWEFLRDQFQRLYGVVETLVTAMGDLADGNTQPAADKIESVLGEGVPLVLDLLAKLIGVNVASGVRSVIDRARDWVTDALTKVIRGILGMFKGGKKGASAKGEGAKQEEKAATTKGAGGMPDELIAPVPVTYEGAQHTLQFDVIGGKVELMMHSDEQQPPFAKEDIDRAEVVGRKLADAWGRREREPDLKRRDPIEAEIAELTKEGAALVAKIATSGKVQSVEIGLYDDISSGRAGKHAHHVPPKGVMGWVGKQATAAVKDLVAAGVTPELASLPQKYGEWLSTLGESATKEHARGGPNLAALSVAATTHIEKSGDDEQDLWRIHWGKNTGAETQKQMGSLPKTGERQAVLIDRSLSLQDLDDDELREVLEDTEAASGVEEGQRSQPAQMSRDQVLLRLKQLNRAEAGVASTQFFGTELDRARTEVATRNGAVRADKVANVLNFIRDVGAVVRSARIQSHNNVVEALRNSKVDGDQKVNLLALNATLAPLEVTTWHNIPGMDKLEAF